MADDTSGWVRCSTINSSVMAQPVTVVTAGVIKVTNKAKSFSLSQKQRFDDVMFLFMLMTPRHLFVT